MIKNTIKKMIPDKIMRWRSLRRVRKAYPSCDIRSIFIDTKTCRFGKKVRIPESSEFWGGSMGDYSYIGEYCCIANAVIGKYCSIGERCSIGGWQHDYQKLTTSPRVYREILKEGYIDQILQVYIGNDVWIGDNTVITKGHIGTGAVIGAGAVVTKDIPPYAIAVGNPARVIGLKRIL